MATKNTKSSKKAVVKTAPAQSGAEVLNAFKESVRGFREAGAALLKAARADRNFRRKPSVHAAVLNAAKIADNIVRRIVVRHTTPSHGR